MSYGSTYFQFDSNGSKIPRSNYKKDYHEKAARVVHYEKEFDVKLSRSQLDPADRTSLKESMVAYSRKMKTLQEVRATSNSNSKSEPLFVRAKHIPKYPVRVQKKRRPLSFDELLGRDREAGDRKFGEKQRPKSEKHKPVRNLEPRHTNGQRLPTIGNKLRNSGKNIQVSLVSASDLYEFVDFSLKNKGTRAESLQMLRMENEGSDTQINPSSTYNRQGKEEHLFTAPKDAYNMFQRTDSSPRYMRERNGTTDSNPDSSVSSEQIDEDTFVLDPNRGVDTGETRRSSPLKLPSINNVAFKYRPKRVKRMRLPDSMLGDIPEDHVIHINDPSTNDALGTSKSSIKSPPLKSSPRSPIDSSSRHLLDSIAEISDKSEGNTPSNDADLLENNTSCNTASKDANSLSSPRAAIGYSLNGSGHYNTSESAHAGNDTWTEREGNYKSVNPLSEDQKDTKKILIRDDGNVRIEVTQCPPKHEPLNSKLKAQRKIKRLIYLRDGQR